MAIDLNTNYSEAYSNRGVAYLNKKGVFKLACQDFRRALRLNPVLAENIQKAIEDCIFAYYDLEFIDQRNISKSNDLPIRTDHLRTLIARTKQTIVDDLRAPEPKPFPVMWDDDLATFRKHAKKNQWGDRQKHGWPYHTNAFKFLHVTYEYWVGRGLTREHFFAVDKAFYSHLTVKVSKEGMPEWLDSLRSAGSTIFMCGGSICGCEVGRLGEAVLRPGGSVTGAGTRYRRCFACPYRSARLGAHHLQ